MRNAKPMIDSVELAELLGCTKRQASVIIQLVNDDLAEQGAYTLNTRPPRAPRMMVYQKLHIEKEMQDDEA